MTERFEIIGNSAPYFVRDKEHPPGRVLPVMCDTRGDAEIFKAKLEAAVAGRASKARVLAGAAALITVYLIGWVLLLPWIILYTLTQMFELPIKCIPIIVGAIRKWALKPRN